MKKLLVVGAGFEQISLIEVGKSMELEVYAIDKNPEAPGSALAHHFAPISTTDFENTLNYVEKENIDGLVTVASETAIPTIARITKTLGLPGMSYETAVAATNKNVMRRKVKEMGIRIPETAEIASLEVAKKTLATMKSPWVLKPSDNSAQRGITFFDDPGRLEIAYQEAMKYSSDGKLILEQFIEGPEINVCAVVKDGKVIFLSLADRITDPHQNFGIAVRHLFPSVLNPDQENEVKELCSNAIQAIGLENGIAYPQIIYGEEGPVFIEIAARMPGGNNREIAMYASGIDMVEAAIHQALDLPYDAQSLRKHPVYPAAYVRFITHTDFRDEKGSLESVDGFEQINNLPGVKLSYFNLKPGDRLPDLIHSGDRFGAIICVGSNREEVVRIAENAFQSLTFKFKE